MNIIKQFICDKRLDKAIKKWNRDIEIITTYINTCQKDNPYFYWKQLVWQEINMYIRLDEQVTKKAFQCLVKRRGFDKYMVNYLREMIIYVGLGKIILRGK